MKIPSHLPHLSSALALTLSLTLSLTLALAACEPSTTSTPQPTTSAPQVETTPAQKAQGPNLVLVTLDTTRADRLGAYGYADAHTPTLDRLATDGALVESAYSTVPLTTPAHASIMSGLYPTRHGIHSNGDAVLPDGIETLAERLLAVGYRTAAFTAAFTTQRVWNLDQGFQEYHDEVSSHGRRSRWTSERPANEVVDQAIGWLREQGEQPTFMWVHFYDPHHPYAPPEPWATRFAEDLYDGEIAFVDEQLGRLRTAVKASKNQAGTYWIVVGDHGEAIEMEHGEVGHGLFVYQTTMHVPFILQGPGLAPGTRVKNPLSASLVDVLPTALGLLAMDIPADLDGRDLSPLLRGGELQRDGVYLESYTPRKRFGYHPELGWVQDNYKLIDTPSGGLYDVVADPAEKKNLLQEQPERVTAMRAALAAVRANRTEGEQITPSAETIQLLAALGYMDGGFEMEPEQEPTVDAKDKIDAIRAFEELRQQVAIDVDLEGAVRAYQKLMVDNPDVVEAALGLGNALAKLGRLDEAIAVYKAAAEREPDSTVILITLANTLASNGQLAEALDLMERVLALVPDDRQAQVIAAKIMSDLQLYDEALIRAEAWLETAPDDCGLMSRVGLLLARQGDAAEARPLLLGSLQDGIPRRHVNRTLGLMALENMAIEDAISFLNTELFLFPDDTLARSRLAAIYMRTRSWDEAASEFHFLCEADPTDADNCVAWAQAIFNTGDFDQAQQVLAPILQRHPDSAMAVMLQANIEAQIGDFDLAKRLHARAEALRQAEVQAQQAQTAP